MRGRPTQKDVAEKAGVSQATVSMVLNNTGTLTVSTETVERIRAVAKAIGYTPNRFAQALKTRKTMTVACIVPDITNPFYPRLIRGVQNVARAHNYDVLTVDTDSSEKREQHFLSWAMQGRVDGVIGVFFHLRVPDLSALLDTGIAVVRVESSRKAGGAQPIDDIFIDSKAASMAVTQRLWQAGHRRIAMVAGAGGPERVRVEGYREQLSAFGADPYIIVDEAFNEVGGLRAGERILESGFAPTAIFAANDLMAIGVMRALKARGLDVPRDVAVFGFDDIPAAPLVSPPLSTVTQFQENLGEKAATILLERLTGEREGAGSTHEMPFQLIERASV
ncbi:UNVERIFIED_ORG: LacI family transcriptional regulator [Martelella mediterranea]